MKKIYFSLMAFLFSCPYVFADVGFSANEFTAYDIRGTAQIRCYQGGQTDWATFYCRRDILDPWELARFYGPNDSQADSVTLTALHADGSEKTKTKSYDSEAGRSERFNLWIHTLFQSPLLETGLNQISYSMQQNGNEIANGSFKVNVTRGEAKTCESRRYQSSNLDDCKFSSNVCNALFRDQNYCLD